METTLALIKPDAMKHHFLDILGMAERSGFDIADLVVARWNPSLAREFYAEHEGKPFFEDLVTFTAGGRIAAMTLVRTDAVRHWRWLIGSTDPLKAEPGTVRNLYGHRAVVDRSGPIMWNAVHGSDSVESAKREIEILRLGFSEYPNLAFGRVAASLG